VRDRTAAFVLAAALTACGRTPIADSPAAPVFLIHPFKSSSSPSPLNEVKAGQVRAIYPGSWRAVPLPPGAVRQGFVASPDIDNWLHGNGTAPGMEAFWIDVAAGKIPSDYYYLAARESALGPLSGNRSCRSEHRRVIVDHPPDFTGATPSPGDYIASGEGTCRTAGVRTHYAYVVIAPGFGPVRQVGLPTSGLYVVMASVTGPRSEFVLKEMIQGAWFGGASIPDFLKAASGQER
jgi:hypothetical protein